MAFKVTITWPVQSGSVWAKLAEKLGREPTSEEAAEEVKRILRGARK